MREAYVPEDVWVGDWKSSLTEHGAPTGDCEGDATDYPLDGFSRYVLADTEAGVPWAVRRARTAGCVPRFGVLHVSMPIAIEMGSMAALWSVVLPLAIVPAPVFDRLDVFAWSPRFDLNVDDENAPLPQYEVTFSRNEDGAVAVTGVRRSLEIACEISHAGGITTD